MVQFLLQLLDTVLKNPEQSKFIVREVMQRFRNFGGVRIEDTIVVTKTGHKSLSNVPRT
jgi:Xaa-Pro dipeptidase